MNHIHFANPGGITKIVNVYVLTCKGGERTPGLGDYLRGCFCLLQLSKLLKLEFAMDLSRHPLSAYLKHNTAVEGVNYSNVHYYSDNNMTTDWIEVLKKKTNVNMDYLNSFIQWLNTQQGPVVSIFSNAVPFFLNYQPAGISFIRSHIEPNDELTQSVTHALNALRLEPKNFSVIHIRAGDQFFNPGGVIDMTFVEKIKTILNEVINPSYKYLLLSDSNELKRYLTCYNNMHMMFKPIEHLGGDCLNTSNANGIRNTLLEFYLMAQSNSILSVTVYHHISGFSQYCSVLNNIPFKYIRLYNK